MNLDKFPKEIKILSIPYKIEYCNNPSNVDIHKRESMVGQIDFWTNTIRIYIGSGCEEDVWHTIWHEVIHAIHHTLKIKWEEDKDEDIVDLLALGVNSVILEYFEYKGNKKINGKSKKKT